MSSIPPKADTRQRDGGLFCVRQLPATVVNFDFSVVSNVKSAGNGKD
jgi:hypothetical protein